MLMMISDRVTEYLSQYGDVQDVTVMYDRNTGRHRGFAYATFGNDKDAVAAINGDNVIDGKWVRKGDPLMMHSNYDDDH